MPGSDLAQRCQQQLTHGSAVAMRNGPLNTRLQKLITEESWRTVVNCAGEEIRSITHASNGALLDENSRPGPCRAIDATTDPAPRSG